MHKLTEQERASLLELSLDMFCVAGTDGYLRWLNPRWSAVLGWTHEELVSAPFIDFVHPDDLEATLAEVERLKQGLPAVQFENRYRHKNGTWRWLEWNTVPQPDGKLFCSVRDITLRKMLERRRSAQHTLLRMAEELGRLGHWRVDLAHQELFWSTEVFRIHGIPPEEGTPKLEEAINAYHPDDRAIVSANLNKAIAEHSGFEFELRLIHRDGSVRHVLCRGICEMAEDGSGPEAVFGIFVDLTDIKKGQQALEAQARRLELHNTMLSQFASIVSHDLRAPLRGITAVSTWIQEAVEEHQWDELPEYVELLLGRAERMGHMLKGLHHFVRVERAQVVQENVDMEEL
ncbi:MAG: PAS domain-containing protein, partial [Myxococcota bacterium]